MTANDTEILVIQKADILSLTLEEAQNMNIKELYQYAIKAVAYRMTTSFNIRIAESLGIPRQYVGSILKGEKDGKRFRAKVEQKFRELFNAFIIENAQ